MSGYAGFAAIYPDYIGFGDSNDTVHPYILKKAAARASLDMIKASMNYMESNGVVLNNQLYITGYSEGGYNAMALAQSVESELTSVNLMGIAPMAGPYNIEDLGNIEINASHTMMYPAFLGYLADAYAYYNSDLDLSDIVVETNTTKFHNLFNGENNSTVIHSELGLTVNSGFGYYKANALFKDSFIADYQDNVNSVIRQKFIENNLDNWTPRSKMNLIHCIDDEIIPFSESNNTYNKFKASGADVILTGIPTAYLSQQVDATHPFVHANCGPEAYGAAVTWFNAIRNGDI
jgi:predicted esterase